MQHGYESDERMTWFVDGKRGQEIIGVANKCGNSMILIVCGQLHD